MSLESLQWSRYPQEICCEENNPHFPLSLGMWQTWKTCPACCLVWEVVRWNHSIRRFCLFFVDSWSVACAFQVLTCVSKAVFYQGSWVLLQSNCRWSHCCHPCVLHGVLQECYVRWCDEMVANMYSSCFRFSNSAGIFPVKKFSVRSLWGCCCCATWWSNACGCGCPITNRTLIFTRDPIVFGKGPENLLFLSLLYQQSMWLHHHVLVVQSNILQTAPSDPSSFPVIGALCQWACSMTDPCVCVGTMNNRAMSHPSSLSVQQTGTSSVSSCRSTRAPLRSSPVPAAFCSRLPSITHTHPRDF